MLIIFAGTMDEARRARRDRSEPEALIVTGFRALLGLDRNDTLLRIGTWKDHPEAVDVNRIAREKAMDVIDG